MNETVVPNNNYHTPVLKQLRNQLGDMTPQIRKAAQYVLNNPENIGFSSVRDIAAAAKVKPNTLVRMARAIGCDGFDDFREPFREHLKSASQRNFPDRARWLQSIAHGGRHAGLFSEMANSTIKNVESLYSDIHYKDIKNAADTIVGARQTFVMGVGISYALASNFAYLAGMALNTVSAVPREGRLPIDDVASIHCDDVVLAMTFVPCRTEIIDAVSHSKAAGAKVIGITDSHTSPLVELSDQLFVISTETPQFFTSAVAALALLETLMAFVVADADKHVINNIKHFHQRRQRLGVYHDED